MYFSSVIFQNINITVVQFLNVNNLKKFLKLLNENYFSMF